MTDISLLHDAEIDPWRFKAVIEGELVHISATVDLAGLERFRRKLIALSAVLDQPAQAIEAQRAETQSGSVHESAVLPEGKDASND